MLEEFPGYRQVPRRFGHSCVAEVGRQVRKQTLHILPFAVPRHQPHDGKGMNGEDPKRRLPILSTYLGHAHVTDTYWYLTGTPELLRAAGERLEKRWEGLNAGLR